ncbi:MAG: hypothetical protein EBR79_01770 [Proteobacteria bacterium]|nr:hypothetical protein [Pseudomonadota bacterium]NBX86184.1 hypothetical protein [Pseudomonadota bacterium]
MFNAAAVVLAGVIGIYSYILLPIWHKSGMEGLKCWWDGGVYVQSGPKEHEYMTLMQGNDENVARMKRGEAKGCLPTPTCALTAGEALRVLEKQTLVWQMKLGTGMLQGAISGFLEKYGSNPVKNLTAGGQLEQAALVEEAKFCADYLQKMHGELVAKMPKEADERVKGVTD